MLYTCQSTHKPQSINPILEHNHSSLDRTYKIPWEKTTMPRKPCAQNHG